jgi:hypothetical protein
MKGVVSRRRRGPEPGFRSDKAFPTLTCCQRLPLSVFDKWTSSEQVRRRCDISPDCSRRDHFPPNFEHIQTAPGTPEPVSVNSPGSNYCVRGVSATLYPESSSWRGRKFAPPPFATPHFAVFRSRQRDANLLKSNSTTHHHSEPVILRRIPSSPCSSIQKQRHRICSRDFPAMKGSMPLRSQDSPNVVEYLDTRWDQ